MTMTLLVVLELSVMALIFAMYVVVPIAVLLAVKALPLPVAVKTAMVVLAISAGAPLLPRKLMTLGREGYVFSLIVTSSLLAVVAVPARGVDGAGPADRGVRPGLRDRLGGRLHPLLEVARAGDRRRYGRRLTEA